VLDMVTGDTSDDAGDATIGGAGAGGAGAGGAGAGGAGAGSGRSTVLPAFPLGTTLLPGQLMGLQVFEPRYRALVEHLRTAVPPEFVVVMIERGHEVGGGDVRSGVGCVARTLHIEGLPEGQSHLLVAGTRRVDVREWLPDDPYPVARVQEVRDVADGDPPGSVEVAEAIATAHDLASMAVEMGGPGWPVGVELQEDSAALTWQLALLAPLGTLDRYRLLAASGPRQRWDLLAGMLTEQRELLAARRRWDGPDG
jgi:hypothetical protein